MTGPIVFAFLILIGVWWWKRPAHMRAIWQAVRPAPVAAGAAPGGQHTARLVTTVVCVLVLLVATIAILAGANWSNPKFATLGAMAWNHWLAVLLFWGACEVILAINSQVFGSIATTLQWVLRGIAAALLVFVVIHLDGVSATNKVTIKTSQETVANPMVLTLGPGEKSKKIPVPYQMHVVMGGKDFRYHCVYGNGDDVSFLPGQPPCPSGDMPYVYAENLRKGDNVITYSYAK